MRKWTCWLLIIVMLLTMAPSITAADTGDEEEAFVLPADMDTIGEEAFAGDTEIKILVIPKNVTSVGSRAFAGCTSLTEVYIGRSTTMNIATDAFANCNDIHFYVYPNTTGELFALSHGYTCDLLDEGSTFLERAMGLVAENGGSSVLQSNTFASKRLIVYRSTGKLPDISAYQPSGIAYRGNIFVVQFDTEDQTRDCYTLLLNDADTVFVEPDETFAFLDSDAEKVSAAGTTNNNYWDTDDPMGFDEYSAFVAANAPAGKMVTIGVVDSGVMVMSSYRDHLRMDGVNILASQDGANWDQDMHRHGSVIASIISDCVGDCNVKILPIRVVGSDSSNTDKIAIGEGILEAYARGARIIVLSMNFKRSEYVEYCIKTVTGNGLDIEGETAYQEDPAVVVVAAGNDGRNIEKVFPANMPEVVTVSGLDETYSLWAYSNYGLGVDYCAPASKLKTTAFSNIDDGTSFAAPMIAAALALTELDPYHIVGDMDNTCYLPNDTGSPANSYGNGLPKLNELARIDVAAITLDASMPAVLQKGQQIQLNWTVLPENATDKTVTVTSDNEAVLSVTSSNGNVYANAVGKGAATLTFTAHNGVSVQRTFTVEQPVTGITISGAPDIQTGAYLLVGSAVTLTANVSPSDANNRSVTWTTSNSAIATVDQNGRVVGVGEGIVTIRATAVDGSGVYGQVSIEVKLVPDASYIVLMVGGQDVTNGKIRMKPGEAIKITAIISPEDAIQDVVFTKVGNYITLSDSGIVTAVSPGTAFVTVTSVNNSSVTATLEIEVVVLPTQVQISGTTTINEGATTQLSATVLPSDATDKTVTWSSGNTSVATVSQSGIVTGIASGTALITATANGDSTVCAQIAITVKHPFVINFNLNKPSAASGTPQLNGVTSITAYSGYPIGGTLPTAQLDRYTFDGWYTAATGGTKITSESTITTTANSYTLYAHWTARTYTVEYNANGGSGSMASQTHVFDQSQALTQNAFTKSNCIFLGWSKTADAATPTYTNGQSVTNLTTEANAVVRLYAIWESVTLNKTAVTLTKMPSGVNISATSATLATVATDTYSTSTSLTASVSGYTSPTTALTATISSGSGSITWSSSNTSVATVNSSGTVTGVASGTAVITATSSKGAKATCTVTVSVGSSAITWSSSNTSVATVSSGTVTAAGRGDAVITASTSSGASATCSVHVYEAYKAISISSTSTYGELKCNNAVRGLFLYNSGNTTSFTFTFVTGSTVESGVLYQCYNKNSKTGVEIYISSAAKACVKQQYNGTSSTVTNDYVMQPNTKYTVVVTATKGTSSTVTVNVKDENGASLKSNSKTVTCMGADGMSSATVGARASAPSYGQFSTDAPNIKLISISFKGKQGYYGYGNLVSVPFDAYSSSIGTKSFGSDKCRVTFSGTSVQWQYR